MLVVYLYLMLDVCLHLILDICATIDGRNRTIDICLQLIEVELLYALR